MNNFVKISFVSLLFIPLCKQTLDMSSSIENRQRIEVEYIDKRDKILDSLRNIPFYSHIEYDLPKIPKPDTLRDSVCLYISNGTHLIIIQNEQVVFSGLMQEKAHRISCHMVKRSDYLLLIINKLETFYIDMRGYNFIEVKYDPFRSSVNYLRYNKVYCGNIP